MSSNWLIVTRSMLVFLGMTGRTGAPLSGSIYWTFIIISTFANKGPYTQSYGFSQSHTRMWELDNQKDWASKNWCFQIVVLGKTLESPLDCKEIKLVNPKGNQPWIFIGRTEGEAETPILWPPDVKNWLLGKNPDAGKDWRQEEKGMTENGWLDGITDSMDMSLSKLC